MKRGGPIWLGLTRRCAQHPALRALARRSGAMVARSAYAQLGYSPLLLAGTLLGMALVYLAPPLAGALRRTGPAQLLGVARLGR